MRPLLFDWAVKENVLNAHRVPRNDDYSHEENLPNFFEPEKQLSPDKDEKKAKGKKSQGAKKTVAKSKVVAKEPKSQKKNDSKEKPQKNLKRKANASDTDYSQSDFRRQ